MILKIDMRRRISLKQIAKLMAIGRIEEKMRKNKNKLSTVKRRKQSTKIPMDVNLTSLFT